MKSLRFTFAVITVVFVASSCSFSPRTLDAPRTVALDREFELRIGEEAKLGNGRVNVKFVALVNDSRCPGDVTCIQEGNAEIELLVSGDEGEKRLSLNTSRNMTHDERYGLYRISLTQLVPYPRTDRPVRDEDYGATLVITQGS